MSSRTPGALSARVDEAPGSEQRRRWEARLLAGLRDRPTPAFVLGDASSQALGFVRSLGRCGVPVVSVSTRPGPRVWSRYCASRDATGSGPALVDRLVSIGRRLPGRGVAVATGDAEVLLLSRNREELGRYFDFVALAVGVDIPYIAYRDILGEPAVPARTYEPGVSWINSLNDCAAILSHYRRVERLGWWRWARAVLTAESHAYFAWDDPMPFLGNLVQTARREAVPFCRMLRDRRPPDRAAVPR